MNNIFIIIAMLFCAISIAIGSLTKDSWRATGITFVFLLIGVIITHVVEELPALSAANRFCGMLLGLAGGMVVIWIFMIVASFVFGAAYDSMIAQNEILTIIDQNNLVLYLLTKL
jgi:hypothetical protein